MRFLYFILHFLLRYPIHLFYPRQAFVNRPKNYFGRTIYVGNHAASFMDPLIVGVLQRPIVFFMTRSDVFTPALKPILWLVHMLPIYRQHDGEDTKLKNQETFSKCNAVLKSGRNLLIYGEGFTDDVFIRRLKPVKKGAARIGFGALEACNWEQKIYMAAVGINYADPNAFGSELLISNSDKFCLNDYKEAYLENPSKTISEVTKRIEIDLQHQITHVNELNWVFFHEHVVRLLRIGMHPEDVDVQIPLKTRWKNARKLALWMNDQSLEENADLVQLKLDLESYFNEIRRAKTTEKAVFTVAENRGKSPSMFVYVLLSPVLFLGILHCYLPYRFVKNFVEKTFKRSVFWSSVKMMLGLVAIGIFNIPIAVLLHHFVFVPLTAELVDWSSWFTFGYYLVIPFFGLLAYRFKKAKLELKSLEQLKAKNPTDLLQKRADLIKRINQLVPLDFEKK